LIAAPMTARFPIQAWSARAFRSWSVNPYCNVCKSVADYEFEASLLMWGLCRVYNLKGDP
jgi:hypothetical protein